MWIDKNKKIGGYDLVAIWNLNRACNFRCSYCYNPLNERKDYSMVGDKDINKIINGFNKTGKKWLICMSGGEPFLHPNFVELCRRLTKKHHISINTNLSLNIDEFCKKIDPKKVEFIHCALHLAERKKLNLVGDFIKKIKELEKSGFNVYVTQVMTPEAIKNFRKIFNFFLKEGIIIMPKIMRGVYRLRKYPFGYTKKQKAIINHYIYIIKKLDKKSKIKKEHIDPSFLDKKFMFNYVSWKGKTCLAGKSCFLIKQDGSGYRCPDINSYLGNIYKNSFVPLKNSIKCNSELCTCIFLGYLFAEGKPKIANNQRKFLKSLRDFLGKYCDLLKRISFSEN